MSGMRAAMARLAWRCGFTAFLGVVLLAVPPAAAAQQSISDVLSFLVTNRSIPTDDFVRDEAAAAATRDAIAGLLLLELATLPISSSAGGFTYRLDPALGTVMRSSDSFGPFYTERSLTAGRYRSSFGLSYRRVTFDSIDGRPLRDGTLVSTATRLRTDSLPFDVETVALRIHSDSVTATANYGVTDRFELGAALPFVRLTLSGQRIDNYRGRELIQATGSASASGVGDLIVRAKYNLVRRGAGGLAIGAEARLPTGDADNLLGAGDASIRPRVIGSAETDRIGLHGEIGYAFGGLAEELDYNGAVTVVAIPRLTLIGELIGRRLDSFGRLAEAVTPHPRLIGVDTIRLTSVPLSTVRVVAVAGLKWNLAGTMLLSANLLKPLTDAGLNARWIPTVTLDLSFGQ
jgi:hypothetical protein